MRRSAYALASSACLARHERYVEFHHGLIEEIERHIPVTAVCSIDEVACRLMDNEISVERSTEIAQSIKSGIAKTIGPYMRCSIGIAPNRYLAKVGTELQKPDGLVVLRAEDLPQKLFSLKLRDLPGVGANIEHRIQKAGIADLPGLFALNPQQMRTIWGSVWGEKLWYLLRGMELPDEITARRSIGHSHVMAPELRDPIKAKDVARRLTLKAASRLRRMEYYAGAMSFSARLENDTRVHAEERFYRAQDNKTFLDLLNKLWTQALRQSRGVRIRKVSVTLSDLVAATDLQPDLFANLPDVDLAARSKSEKLSRAMDKINHRFGRDSIVIGMTPSQGQSFSGTKIAFTRKVACRLWITKSRSSVRPRSHSLSKGGSQKASVPICAARSALRRTAISQKSAPSCKSRMGWWCCAPRICHRSFSA